MKTILSDYLEVCTQFRKDSLSKPERKQRHSMLVEWGKIEYKESVLKIAELHDFWNKYGDFCYNKIFILKVVVPAVAFDLENGDIEGLQFLFRCFRGHEDSYLYTDSPLAIFCEASGYKYNPFQLANRLLEQETENKDVLKYKYHRLKDHLEYSLHEMPQGILNGLNGANISDIQAMIHSVDEFQILSDKLDIKDDSSLIKECRTLYPAYEKYLQCYKRYNGFEDYLKNNIHNE